MAGSGTYTLGLAFGGQTSPQLTLTEDWNGTSWVEVADMSDKRSQNGGAGSFAAGLTFGGSNPSVIAATEEWNSSSNTIKTVDQD